MALYLVKKPPTVYEGLSEITRRRLRRKSATWPTSTLESGTSPYVWQPETLCYTDQSTGRECWRVTNQPTGYTSYYNDIGQPAWSADGKWIGLRVWGRPTQAHNNLYEGNYRGQWAVKADGTYLHVYTNVPRRDVMYDPQWSPQIPDTYYDVGSTVMGGTGNPNKVYKVTVSTTGETFSEWVDFGNNWGFFLRKMISPDGRRLLLAGITNHSTSQPPEDDPPAEPNHYWYYPLILWPDASKGFELPAQTYKGYNGFRYLGHYGATYWPRWNVAAVDGHDRYPVRDGKWFWYMCPGGQATWWRLKTLGSKADGGADYDNTDFPVTSQSYDFGEAWPENHGRYTLQSPLYGDSSASPFVDAKTYQTNKTTYWSHVVPDRWGRFALFSSVDSDYTIPNGPGPGIWDVSTHSWVQPSYGGTAQHHNWQAWSDWCVSTDYPGTGVKDQAVMIQDRTSSSSQVKIAYCHTQVYGGYQYYTWARPTQSPDGTKVGWHSEFLADKNESEPFWSVAHYPKPPNTLSASGTGGTVDLEFLPPTWTSRKWPYVLASPTLDSLDWPTVSGGLETEGATCYARETKRYHVWRSTSSSGPWTLIGSVTANYSATYVEDATKLYLHPVDGSGYEITASNKIAYADTPGDGTHYYAATAEEHSGLESNQLSEILEVIVSSGSVTGTQVAVAEGTEDFWTTAPSNPTNLSVTPQGTSGHVSITWSEPSDTKVRYYNLYYSPAAKPPATQEFRIASTPVGQSSYFDWLASLTSSTHYYRITSVDRYGNESTGI